MSTDMIRMDGVYCVFVRPRRAEHIMNSNDHPECRRCGRRFLNGQILRRHCVTAPNHHYCVPYAKHCRTAAGFRVHMEQVHGSDDDDSDDDSSEEEDYYDLEDGWEDERSEEEYLLNQETSPSTLHGKTAMSMTLKTRSTSGYRHHLMMGQPTRQRRVMRKMSKRRLPSYVRCAKKSTRLSVRLRVDMCTVYGAFAPRLNIQRHVRSATNKPPGTSFGRYIYLRSDKIEWLGGVA
ncbi:hypothetical protein EDD18DRAFT_1105604 [Armillaria luteobubalina]|uniref:Uncharacterized protein n=1 Tax=Armillaria luteobubalina TaxID=153913 RepID=A0AA39Q6I3_9AGAR|nr:hypothetical protein EDD18DRAFT_1105604 [Armillaria luteobubalina]